MKISLISMPMVNLQMPSLGLTLLKSALHRALGRRVECRLHYLYHDFARHLGVSLYNFLLDEMNSGIGEWFFRSLAFPDEPDNSREYFRRYFTGADDDTKAVLEIVMGKRKGLDEIFAAMIDEHELCDASIVGFTSLFYQNVASLAMARRLKTLNPQIITVMGGANVEFPMGLEILKNFEHVDYIFSGPGIVSFPEFADRCLNGDHEGCHDIQGVWSKKNRPMHPNHRVSDFSHCERADVNLPLELDYDSFLDSRERSLPDATRKPYLFFTTSEGCWRGERVPCAFCAQGGPCGNNMKFSCMTPENAVHRITSLYKYAGRAEFLYAADSIMPRRYPEKVFSKIKSEIPLHLELHVGMDEEEIKRLAAAGVGHTEAGIESLSSDSLRLMKKGTDVFMNLRFMMDCMMNNIFVTWNFLLGVPGESEKTYEKFCRDIPGLTHFPPPEPVLVTFERFSEYHDNPEKYGLKLIPFPFYALTYPFGGDSASKIAYNFFDAGNGSYKKALESWTERLDRAFGWWKSLWNGKAGTFPCLYSVERDGLHFVSDSRTGETVEFPLSDAGFRLLNILRRPRSAEYLVRAGTGLDIQREMEELMARGLVFHEKNRFFNVVFPSKPRLGKLC